MKKTIIQQYFQAWLEVDIKIVENVFSQDIIYTECYGPQYHGLNQVLQWFIDWNKKGKVLEWSIKRFIEEDQTLVVEWHFQCHYNNQVSEFDGVTIADFNENMKICRLSEFQSKFQHNYPYSQHK